MVDPLTLEAELVDWERRVEELIRACMAEKGFEYAPGAIQVFHQVDERSEEERVRTDGFGLTTGDPEDPGAGTTMEIYDANEDRLEAMSPAERETWYAALNGTDEERAALSVTEVDPDTGEVYTYIEGHGPGCRGEAMDAALSEADNLRDTLYPDLEDLYERVRADPRIIARQQEWSSCMAQAGYSFPTMESMREFVSGYFTDRFVEITEDAEGIDGEALASLRAGEIELAVADFECRRDYDDLYQQVFSEHEGDFIDAHRETLAQIRDLSG